MGRIAFSLHDRVDVEPIHYVFSDPWIFGRTSQGARLLSPAPHRDIIFGIHASEISGRCSTSSAADSTAPAVSSVMGPT